MAKTPSTVENTKIFISYHKSDEIIHSEIMKPIHVGSALSKTNLNILRDDSGDNISAKNNQYCELTAQYWAWKNVDADYYGFMHYRRHFVFRDIPEQPEYNGVVLMPCIDESYLKYIGLNDDEITTSINGYDIVLPTPVDTSSWGAFSNEMQFCSLSNLHAIDFDIMCLTVIDLYPEYSAAVNEFRYSTSAYWYNMFIMRKDIFCDYSLWLFNILEEVERRIDFFGYNAQEMRTLAFMAERLLSIYLIHLAKNKPELKIKHLKISFIGANKSNAFINALTPTEKAFYELSKLEMTDMLHDTICNVNDKFDLPAAADGTIFYGAGAHCHEMLMYYERLKLPLPTMIWDAAAQPGQQLFGIPVQLPDFESLRGVGKETLCVITIENRMVSESVEKRMREYGFINTINFKDAIRTLSRRLWLLLEKERVSI